MQMSFNTPTHSKKRELSSPDFDTNLKKNKTYADIVMSPPTTQDVTAKQAELNKEATASQGPTLVGTANIPPSTGNGVGETTSSSVIPCITIPQEEMEKLSSLLVTTFQDQIEHLVGQIVSGVTAKLNEKINQLELANSELRNENANFRSKIQDIEEKLDEHEQYSRRNNIRVSGVAETKGEITDDVVLDICNNIGADITVNDIDRSHRVGKPKESGSKPRDIIVKMCSYRSRQKIMLQRSTLKVKGHGGVYINEDLTRKRSYLLYKSRELVRSRHLLSAWSADGNILVKDNKSKIHRVQSENQLDNFLLYLPRPDDQATTQRKA